MRVGPVPCSAASRGFADQSNSGPLSTTLVTP